MDERHRHRSLTHRRGDTLEVSAPDIAHGEHSWTTGLEEVGRPGQRPASGFELLTRQLRARLDEAFLVEGHAAAEPPRVRNGASHHEHVPDRAGLDLARRGVSPGDLVEMSRALQ